MRDTLLHQPMRFHVRHSRPLSLYNNILSISLIYSIIFTHLCTTILTLFMLLVLPLLFLFGGLTNGKESEPNSSNGNGNSERNEGQKDAMSTSNRLPSPRVPSTSPTSSGKILKDKSGIASFYFFNYPT